MLSRILPLLLLLAIRCFGSGALRILAPADAETISGNVTFSVECESATVSSVDFAMGSHPLGRARSRPFRLDWDSNEAMDGVVAVQIVARDLTGTVQSSGERVFSIANRGASLVVTSPDLRKALSGTINLSVTGTDLAASPAVWSFNVDGEEQAKAWTDNNWKSPATVSARIDTTRFSNGEHELHISMNSRTGPVAPQWMNWRSMINRVVQFENGHSPMEISGGFQNIEAKPGDRVSVGCRREFTDGLSEACFGAVYAVTDPAIAGVDRISGSMTALKAGFTSITVTEGVLAATVRVRVSEDPRVPHFAGNGETLRGFQAGKSLFLIAPFFLDPDALRADNSLQAEVVRAGVNTLSTGFYTNPRSITAAFADWKRGFDNSVLPRFQYARDHGFHLLVSGDDLARRIGLDAWYTLNWPSAPKAVAYAAAQLASTHVAIGIEAIDEASMLWGARPQPEGHIGRAPYVFENVACTAGSCTVHWPNHPLGQGAAFALRGSAAEGLNTPPGTSFSVLTRSRDEFTFHAGGTISGTFDSVSDPGLEYLWFAGPHCVASAFCDPPVSNSALTIIRRWIADAAPGLPVAFPALSIHPVAVQSSWMGKGSISDYASHYFSSLKTRTTYPWGEGIQEMVSTMGQQFLERQPFMDGDHPQLALVSLAGPSYTKLAAYSRIFNAGVDRLDAPGVSAQHVTALMMTAASLGAAGLRLYYFEPPLSIAARGKSVPGTHLQTGCNPFNLQADSWRAMGFSADLLTRVLAPYLLDTAIQSPAFGRNISTAAREGAAGRMLLIVNGNDWERTMTVDFRPFTFGYGALRYRVTSTGIQTSVSPAEDGEIITLAAGESLAYLYPRSDMNSPMTLVAIPAQGGGPEAIGVQYSYIYDEYLDRAPVVPCGSLCEVFLDRRLGDVTYRLIFAGSASPYQILQKLGAE